MSTWHYMKNGAQSGPASTEELRSLLASGAVRGDTLVWRDGLSSWTAASSVTEFSGSIPALATGAATVAPGALATDPADVEKNRVFGIIAYLPPLLFLVGILAARQSKFAMYHCNQGLVLTIAAFAAWFVTFILGFILVFIPFVGWLFSFVLHMGVFLGTIALAIIGLLHAANGVCKPLPLIGNRFTLIK